MCVGGGGGGGGDVCVRVRARGRVFVCVHACEYFLSFSFASHHFSVHFFLFFP